MPALPSVPGVVRVQLSGLIGATNPWLTRHFIKYTGTAPTAAQLTTYNTSIGSAITADIVSLISTNTNVNQIETTDLSSSTGAVAVSAVSLSGTRSGANIPGTVAMVTSYEIARRYRGGHPRGYWSMGLATDVDTEKQWLSAFVTSVNTGVAAYFTALNAAGWTGAGTLSHVNVSYYSGFTVVTNPTTGRARNVPTVRATPLVDAVTSVVSRQSIGTQRRRSQFVD